MAREKDESKYRKNDSKPMHYCKCVDWKCPTHKMSFCMSEGDEFCDACASNRKS